MIKREAGKGGGWIGVDLDGTLAHYTPGTFAANVIGKPIAPMVKRVKRWLAQGRDVRIFTARVAGDPASYVYDTIDEWCAKHFNCLFPITCEKDFEMDELWDDRAVQVEMNTGRVLGKSTRGLR